jgi:hypothetical protein
MSAAAPILPDLRLIQAATAIDIAYTRDRLAVIAGAPGNPFGVEIRDFGRGTAFQAAPCRRRTSTAPSRLR